jgi:hypothetical protein
LIDVGAYSPIPAEATITSVLLPNWNAGGELNSFALNRFAGFGLQTNKTAHLAAGRAREWDEVVCC